MTNKDNKKNVNIDTLFAIRDARGLTTHEKVFLYTVASRGVAKTGRDRLMADTDMSTGMITKVVRSLTEKGLINVYPGGWVDGHKTVTMYTVDDLAMTTYLEEWID